MAKTTPMVCDGNLTWSDEMTVHVICIGTSLWYDWLTTATTFAFTSSFGTFTARKERFQRGGWYWKAYRRQKGNLHRTYLGKSENLTLEHLHQAAQTLNKRVEQGNAGEHAEHSSTVIQQKHSFLATNVAIPPVRADYLERPRLIEQLNQGAQRLFTLVSAPPGSGKTTLLSAWSQLHHRQVVWLSLEKRDNDPVCFLADMTAAMQRLEPGIDTLPSRLSHSPLSATPDLALASLVHECAASFVGVPVILILDDYHVISTQPIHIAIQFLLHHLPQNVHIIISSRVDPPWPLGRLRAQGTLNEIHALDLSCTVYEAELFFSHVMGLRLTQKQVAELTERTEGWIAGLQLAALALEGRTDISGFVETFTGHHHYIGDYLTEEVLHQQPYDVQEFLLYTAILDQMSDPLCEYITGQSGSQFLLERLERDRLFLIPLDEDRCWYRYHHLFADVLRQQLLLRHPAQVAKLHAQAAVWFETHGFLPEAITHALAAKDFATATRLIERTGRAMLMRGEVSVLLNWLHSLSEEVFYSHPQLCLLSIWGLLAHGQQEAAERRLQKIEQKMDTLQAAHPEGDKGDTWRSVRGEATAAWALIASLRGDITSTVTLSRQALEDVPAHDSFVRGMVTATLGGAYYEHGDLSAASQEFARAMTLNQIASNLLMTLSSANYLATIQRLQGRLHLAAKTNQHALRLARDEHGQLSCAAGMAYINLAGLFYEWNELDAALKHCLKGIELSKQWGIARYVALGYLTLSQVKQAQGDTEEAQHGIMLAEELVQKHQLTSLATQVATHQVRLWIIQERPGEAVELARASGLHVQEPPDRQHLFEYITLAWISLAQGPSTQQESFLEQLWQVAEATGRIRWMIEVLLLQSSLFQARGQNVQAMAVTTQALMLAEPEGYVRVFVEKSLVLLPLFSATLAAQRRGRLGSSLSLSPTYVSALCKALKQNHEIPLETHTMHSPLPVPPLPEPLSARELDVLRLLAAGRSNQQIADELILAPGTVKIHLQSIYRKLNVHSRTHAVIEAHALTLL